MSVPRPSRSAYLRRLHESRMQQQLNMARGALRRRRWRILFGVVGVLLMVAAAGGALALSLERVFR